MLELRLQEQHLFIKVFEDAPIGMCLVSPDGRFLKVNQSICRMLGYSEYELTNLTIQSVTYPDDLIENMALRQKAISGEIESYRMEKRYIHKSGEIIWGLLSVTVERDEQGNLGFFISQLVDITEQKMREHELRKVEELHQLISEHSQDVIVRVTPSGIISYISPAVRNQLGYTPEELIGKYCFDYWHPEDLDCWFQQDQQDNVITVYRIRHKKGHYVWQETQSKKIRNADGDIQHVIGIGRDITQRKNIEVRLQENEQRHKSLLKYTPVGICAVDTEGNFTEVNPAYEQMTGYSSEELLTMNFKALISPENLILVGKQFHDSLKKDCYYEGVPMLHKDGSEIFSIAWSSPIIIKGETVGIYVIAKDITEQKQTEEFLKKSEKLTMVGELAAGIAHEIRNPLTSLRGFVQLHQFEDKENKHKLHHEVMLSEIDRINEIVSELLVLAKPSNESSYLLSITKSLDHVITLLEGQAHLYNIVIQKDFDEELPLIHCQGSLKQVFINVLKNAIESMPNGGNVLVQVKRLTDSLTIRFVDQGCGIPQELLPKIGSPFYTTKETGTGLGLMVSQRIIQNHKGTMRIFSEIGKGTTVEVNLTL